MRGWKTSPAWPRSMPIAPNSDFSPAARAKPERQPDGRADQADDQRLEQHRPGDLRLGRAQRPEQGQFPGALRDDDREGVEDQEGADDQRDRGEHQQERGDERQSLLQLVLVLGGDLLVVERLEPGRQRRGDLRPQLLRWTGCRRR